MTMVLELIFVHASDNDIPKCMKHPCITANQNVQGNVSSPFLNYIWNTSNLNNKTAVPQCPCAIF